MACTSYRLTLKEQSRCSQIPGQGISHTSHVNYRLIYVVPIYCSYLMLTQHLTVSTVVKHLVHLRREYRKTSLAYCRLKDKIVQSCDDNGIRVNEGLHNDLKAITEMSESTKLAQGLPKDSFLSIFWQQQSKAASLTKSNNMKWHPLMIRWCLSLQQK